MKTNTTCIHDRLRLPGAAALDTPSHDSPNVMQPPKPLRRILTGLATALAVIGLSQSAAHANGTPYYFDVDGGTPGFGEPTGSYDLNASALWSTDPTGSATTAAFDPSWDPGAQWTFGATDLDFAGTPPFTFTINANGAADWFRINGIAVNSPNANITLSGVNMLNANAGVTTWYVAAGSSLTVDGNYGGIGGLNWGGQGVNFTGGGTFNWVTLPGINAGGTTIIQSGPVVNMKAPSLAADAGAGWSWLTMANYTLAEGTLNFATADAAGAFRAYGNNNGVFTITGGTVDNTSSSAMTLDLKGIQTGQGIIKLGGDFAFTGSDDLDFGTTPVTLTATPQITVTAKNLTIGGAISGGAFGLTKAGPGTLALSGANAYTGATTVSDGKLQLNSNVALNDQTDVYLNTTSGTLDLNFTGIVYVKALYIDGNPQPDAVYTSSTPPITGGGSLQVGGVVPPISTETTLGSSLNPSLYGKSVTFTATVTPVPSGGTVQFFDDTTPLDSPVDVNIVSGKALLTTTALAVGTHPITATYNGFGRYTTSSASALSQEVNPVPPAERVCWYDAALGVTADPDTGVISEWLDQSGKGYPLAEPANSPVLVANQVNGLPAVQLRGSYFRLPGPFFVKEQYVVVRAPSASWSNYGAALGRASGRNSSYLFSSGNTDFWADQYPLAVSKNGTALTEPFALAPITSFMVLKITVNDNDTSDASYRIGRADGFTCDMDVAEIIGYNGRLTPEEEATLTSSLITKYGIGGGTPYDTWLAGYTFASGADKTPTGDPDGDSQTNQQEFAFGLDPTSGASVNPITKQLDSATGTFEYTRYAASGLDYKVELSTDLLGWDPATILESPGIPDPISGVQIVTVTLDPYTPPLDGKLFLRVSAE